MAGVVNLRTERKRAKRRQAEQEAAANRLAHGRPKAARNLNRAQSDKYREASTNTGSRRETSNEIAGH